MTLWEQIQPFLDPATGLLMAPDGGKDNLVLLSAYLWRELSARGEVVAAAEVYCNVLVYVMKNEVESGLYRKFPGGDMSEDNLIGMAYVNKDIATLILARWDARHGCFDCDNPRRFRLNRYFYPRHIGMKQFLRERAWGGSPLSTFIWACSCVFTTLTTSGSSDALTLSLQVDVFERSGKARYATRLFRRHFSVKQLYSEWFKSPDFPLAHD